MAYYIARHRHSLDSNRFRPRHSHNLKPGDIAHCSAFPYEEDRHAFKHRWVFILLAEETGVYAHGIFSRWRPGRAVITRAEAPSLQHDGFVDPRIEILPIRDINRFLCSTPVDFDSLGDFDTT